MSVIDINNITKDYGHGRGVFDVTFAVEKGEVVGFLGPNGAGKTTTIRLLCGFTRPDGGMVSINGMDCFADRSLIQQNMGYLPGEIAFMDDMTGTEFIRFAAKMRHMTDMTRAEELMKLFELDASGKIKKMSKGMKQKIGIVCTFMHSPDILVLDEPTSGLDPLMQNKFVQLILEEKAKGKTILMSSHMFEEVERTCDRTAIIKDGHIVAVEDMDSLRKTRGKTFEITFTSPDAAAAFAAKYKLPAAGVSRDVVSVKVRENLPSLLNALSVEPVKDLNVRAQTLEELFMHYYGGENK